MKKSGFYFIEGMPKAGGPRHPEPGTATPEYWEPYKLWVGDRWECEGCGHVILSGFGREPISEHYKTDFGARVTQLNADQFQVNDC